MSLTRKLSEELRKKPKTDYKVEQICQLAEKLSCCDGAGYRITTKGAYVKAEVCSCVTSCPQCLGKARKLVDGLSKNCISPNPAITANLLNNASIPARYYESSLREFSNFTGNGMDVRQKIYEWAQNFSLDNPRGLILGGPVGVGKTYLLTAIAKYFAQQGLSVKFVDFFQLLNELKAGYNDSKADQNLLKPLIDIDVLFIDEMGKGRNSDWEMSILDQLVMGRYNQNKIVIASTNYNLQPENKMKIPLSQQALDNGNSKGQFELFNDESLESRIGLRIYSRLVETSNLVELTGNDYRQMLFQDRQNNRL